MIAKQSMHDLSVLVLAPTGKDGDLVSDFLSKVGLDSIRCQTLAELTGHLENGLGPAVIAEEALSDGADIQQFLRVLTTQPEWSDIPLLIIRSNSSYCRYVEQLTQYFSTTIQKRPVHLPTFLSSVQNAVEARRRQLEVKHKTDLLKEAHRYAESIIETIEESILVLDADLKVISANKRFYETFNIKANKAIGHYIYELADGHWRVTEFRRLLERVLPEQKSIENYEIEYPGKKGVIHLLLNSKQITKNSEAQQYILLAFHDITLHKLQEKALKDLTEELLLVEEKQRQQIATALHDSVSQMLAFSKREVASLLKEPSLRTNDRLKKVMDSLTESIRQSRELTVDLSSPTLHTFGLEAGLEEMVERFSGENGLICRFHASEEPKSLEKKVELLLYRSVKELLCNIAKHAKAHHVEVAMKTDDVCLELKVTDDGKGFDTARLHKTDNCKSKPFGLFSIEQRLTNLGGSFKIESEKKKGTTVTLYAPLKKQ